MSISIISFETMCLVVLLLDIAELVWGFLISMKIQESPPVKNYDIYKEKFVSLHLLRKKVSYFF